MIICGIAKPGLKNDAGRRLRQRLRVRGRDQAQGQGQGQGQGGLTMASQLQLRCCHTRPTQCETTAGNQIHHDMTLTQACLV